MPVTCTVQAASSEFFSGILGFRIRLVHMHCTGPLALALAGGNPGRHEGRRPVKVQDRRDHFLQALVLDWPKIQHDSTHGPVSFVLSELIARFFHVFSHGNVFVLEASSGRALEAHFCGQLLNSAISNWQFYVILVVLI